MGINHKVERFTRFPALLEKDFTALTVEFRAAAVAEILLVEMIIPFHSLFWCGMPVLPEYPRVVSTRLQGGHYIGYVGPSGHEAHGSRAVAVPACCNDCAARRADRSVHVCPVEEHALGSKSIEAGCEVLGPTSIHTERFCMKIVRGEKQNVGALILCSEGEGLEGESNKQ